MEFYKPLFERTPDTQYRNRIAHVLEHGELVKDTAQRVGAITCFGTLPDMVFDLSNGVPLITERDCSKFWKKAVAEIIAFINGARTIDEIESYGCDFWKDYRGLGTRIGLDPDDMGPGSYGAAFHDFPRPDGGTFNQFAGVLEQIREMPFLRSFRIHPWVPYYVGRGADRKVIVTPCHGWLHFRVINGRMDMVMTQHSADLPIGVPSNMLQYAALLLMMCQVTGYRPGVFVHKFTDAHIYENQVAKMRELIQRPARPLPLLRLTPGVTDLFAFRADDFSLEEYDPHPGMKVPYTP